MAGDDRLDEIVPPAPTLDGLEQVVRLAQQRCKRARHKRDLAVAEIINADSARDRAVAARDAWIEANPETML